MIFTRKKRKKYNKYNSGDNESLVIFRYYFLPRRSLIKFVLYQSNIDGRKSVGFFSGIVCYTMHRTGISFRYGLWQSTAQKFLLPSKNFWKQFIWFLSILSLVFSDHSKICVRVTLFCVFYCGLQLDSESFKVLYLKICKLCVDHSSLKS